MMRALTCSGQCFWSSNNLQVTIDSINVPSYVDSIFSIVVEECGEICHLRLNECFGFIPL